MSFIFGWYSFKLKSYTAEDLAITDLDWGDTKFEVRQNVFHLFWLPFFSLGKVYAIRKEGKLYDPSPAIVMIMKAKEQVKTPWYAYLIPILLVVVPIVVGIYIFIAEAIMRHNSFNRNKEQYEISMLSLQKEMIKLTPNHYLKITNPALFGRYGRDGNFFLKVIDVNDTLYRFHLIDTKNIEDIPYPFKLYRLFEKNKSKLDTIRLTKNQLQKAICLDYALLDKRKPCGFPLLGDETPYVILKVENLDGPVIDGRINYNFWKTDRIQQFPYQERFTGFQKDRSWAISMELQNLGSSVDLIEIKNEEGQIKWIDSLPINFSYQYLGYKAITGATTIEPKDLKFKARLIFQDSLSRKHEYILAGEKSYFSITRKE